MARVRALASAALNERPPHIGLNLIFLVPGETGGMEVAARELIPALVKAAPELRFTAFVNREAAAAKDGPWGELLPAVTVPVNARNRVQWVRGEQQLLPRLAARAGVDLVHSLASTAPCARPLSPRGHRPRPDLRALPRGARRYPRPGDARARAAGGAPLRSRDRRSRTAHSAIWSSCWARTPSASTWSLWGSARSRREQPLPEHELRERLRLGERPSL